ncbi:hypothetical protein PsYK624_046550 [Phanerochaete sordida]|uniref:Uncharacterized protein n=1 Tax=Phanerochaete sordida TaxID=48140 RepID=A0A9P3LC69_9APHY|nr:hypothetical protein PsYK624_046550 [Phanerochaete sordida]
MEVDTVTSVPAEPVDASTPANLSIPGLCFVEVGRAHAAVYNVSFQVDDEAAAAAARWCKRGSTTDPTASYAVFHLLCLRTSDVQDVVQNSPFASAEAVAAAFRDLRTQWPPRGQLIVEMNSHSAARGTWLPKRLGPDDGPLDVTAHIVSGTNTIRFVQLGGHADRLFTLYVGRPDKRDETSLDGWENWANSVQTRS